MKSDIADIADIIAVLVRRKNSEIDSRLAGHAEALSEAKCTSPLIGSWVDSIDVEYLLAALDLEDKDFASRFPASAHFGVEERRRVAATIDSHIDICKHCSLKLGFELELDGNIAQACLQNKDFLLQLLGGEDAAAEEGDGRNGEAEGVCSANHEI